MFKNYTEETVDLLQKEGLLHHVQEWIAEGWGLEDAPAPEQYAASLLMEARSEDGYSDPSYCAKLRRVAFTILDKHRT